MLLIDSRIWLGNQLGTSLVSFSYPSGDYDERVQTMVEQAGYRFAVTTNSGEADLGTPFELARYRIGPDTDIRAILK